MSILILNSWRNAEVPYADWLASLDEDLLLVCSSRRPAPAAGYAEVRAVDDYEVSGMVEAVAWELFDRWGYRTVVAKAECDIVRAARLRELAALDGQSLTSALAYRDKVVMKTYTSKAGICTPAFRRLDSTLDLLSFVREHGYPVFVKPVDASGATGTDVLRGPADVRRFVARGLPAAYQVEEFVAGDMYHVDGVVVGGCLRLAQPSRYLTGGDCLAFKDDRAVGSYFLHPSNPLAARLQTATRQVIEALPSPRDFAFHCEFFYRPDDALVFCEIASRTGGVRINETVRLGTGIDMDRVWVRAQCGIAVEAELCGAAPGVLAGQVVVPPRHGRIVRVPEGPPDFVREYRPNATPGEEFTGAAYAARKSGDYVASFVVTGASEIEVEQRLRGAVDWFEAGVRWAPAPSGGHP